MLRLVARRTLLPTSYTHIARSMSTNPVPEKIKPKKEEPFVLKVPKGTKDWADKDMTIRSAVFDTLTKVFKNHGAITIDTPVFELREILQGKYGEDSKLIYNLEDQGGELTSLRYDLTVPFARFVAMNGIQNIKRYHIAKVYRRDQPAMTKGRMREFYQCDIDIAGTYDLMVPDAEILSIAVEGLTSLGINDFTIKVNHRKLLDGIFQKCGVADEDVRKVSSAVDKLDKSPWSEVKREMVQDKAQPEDVADKIGEYVQIKGDFKTVLEKLASDEGLMANENAVQGVKEMQTLLPYIEAFGVTKYLSFDLSLARGLDYYTGLIYEAVTSDSAPPELTEDEKKEIAKKKKKTGDEDNSETVGVGSIMAGGRYDNLVGMFAAAASSKKKKAKEVASIPCVGVSFGVERLFSIIKAREGLYDKARASSSQVYVMAAGSSLLPERMNIANQLWKGGIAAEFMYKEKVKWPKQCEAAEKAGIPYAVILGESELKEGIVKVKELGRQDANYQGDDVKIDQLVPYVKKLLADRNNGVDEAMNLLTL